MDNQVENTVVKEKKGTKITIILVFIGICFISFLKSVFEMDFSDAYTSDRSLGYLFGSIIGGCLIVFGISALIYRISRKGKRGIILIMSLIYLVSSIGMLGNKISERMEKRENEYSKIRLAEEKISSMIVSVASGNKIIEEHTTYEKYGEAAEALNFAQDFYVEMQELSTKFNNDVYELDVNKILSNEILGDNSKLLDVSLKINQSIETLNEYYESIDKLINIYLEKIKTFYNSNNYSKNFAVGVNSSVIPSLKKLVNQKESCINQYKSMKNILMFLEEKNVEYTIQGDELFFFTDDDVDTYNKLIFEYNNSVEAYTELVNNNDKKVKDLSDFFNGEDK